MVISIYHCEERSDVAISSLKVGLMNQIPAAFSMRLLRPYGARNDKVKTDKVKTFIVFVLVQRV